MKKVIDSTFAKRQARGHSLKITLKKEKGKGTGIYAVKKIKKGETIAYYRFKVFDEKNFKPFHKETYVMTVYSKKDRGRRNVIGDLFPESLIPPKRVGKNSIPYWGYFINEPSKGIEQNAELDLNLKENYKNRDKVKPGDIMIYKLYATRTISPGEEITWCYGDNYDRNYESNCD